MNTKYLLGGSPIYWAHTDLFKKYKISFFYGLPAHYAI